MSAVDVAFPIILLIVHALLLPWATLQLRPTAQTALPQLPTRITRRETAAVAGVVVAGALLRLIHINSDLWLDEIATVVNYLRLSPLRVFAAYTSANQHLLYSFLGSISIHLLGESPFAARLPAVVYGVAGIAAMWWFARTVASRAEALLVAALMALSYHHIWFSQNARGYTGMIFWSVLGSTCFLRAIRSGAARDWTGFVLSFAIGIGTLQNSAFVFAAAVIAYFVLHVSGDERAAPAARRGAVIAAAACVALLAVDVHALALRNIVHFFATTDRTGLGSMSIAEFLPVLIGGLSNAAPLPVLLAGAAVAGAGWISYWRRDRLCALLLILPVPLNVCALFILKYGAYPRSFLYALPTALLLAVRGSFVAGEIAARAHPRLRVAVPAVMLTALLAGSTLMLPRLYAHPKQDYRGALHYVMANSRQGDAVAAVGLAAVAYRLYYAPSLLFPSSSAELEALRLERPVVWVLYTLRGDMELHNAAQLGILDRDFERVAVFRGTVGDGDIHVMRSLSRAPARLESPR